MWQYNVNVSFLRNAPRTDRTSPFKRKQNELVYDIAQPSLNGRRVNKTMADGSAVNIKTIKAI